MLVKILGYDLGTCDEWKQNNRSITVTKWIPNELAKRIFKDSLTDVDFLEFYIQTGNLIAFSVKGSAIDCIYYKDIFREV